MTPPVARYGFLPYLRSGFATKVEETALAPGRLRSSIDLVLSASSTSPSRSEVVARSLEIRGPGDIVGIDRRVIIRTDPRPRANDFESNLFPLVDFAPPDFPWRYTPVAAADSARRQLRPWICLIVLQQSEITNGIVAGKPLPRINVAAAALPDLAESWAWAHVQVSDTVNAEVPLNFSDRDAVKQHLTTHPHLGISRIVCMRRLAPQTRYIACVVPTFEAGRRAGLALPLNGIAGDAPAWSADDSSVDLCIYYSFEFFTGDADFELLARRLEGKKLGRNVGYRDVDFGDPGPDSFIPGISAAAGRTDQRLRLGGALRSLVAEPDAWPDPQIAPDPFQRRLQQLLDINAAVDDDDDPFLVPPIYGRWHSASHQVAAGSTAWMDHLNLDPRHRLAAGFGTEAVQNKQESYVAEAWRQIGDIELANDAIRAGQAGIAMQQRLHERYLSALPVDTALAVTRSVQGRVAMAGKTVLQDIRESKLTEAVLSPAYRKVLRPEGPLRRHANADGRHPRMLHRLGSGDISVAPRIDLGGVVSLDKRREVSAWLRPIITIADRLRRNRAAAVVRRMSAAEIEATTTPPRLELQTKARWTGAPDRKDPVPIPDRARAAHAREFQSAAARAMRDAEAAANIAMLRSIDPSAIRDVTLDAVRPSITIPAAVLATLDVRVAVAPTVQRFDTIMDYPVFTDAMYEPLRDLSSAHLLPGAELVDNDSVGLLRTSYDFIEAFLVGVNHEMAAELLWRQYPTDQRGSYFRQFWDIETQGTLPPPRSPERETYWDIAKIHQWRPQSTLGAHPPGVTPRRDTLVLLIRGQLLQKYPNTLIYAVKAAPEVIEGHTYYKRKGGEAPRLPIFRGTMPPDMTFVGFDLTESEVRQGDGFMFVLEEPLTEARFGMDVAAETPPAEAPAIWNDLHWGHVDEGADYVPVVDGGGTITSAMTRPKGVAGPSLTWGRDAASMAAITLQLPFRVLFHSSRLLPERDDA